MNAEGENSPTRPVSEAAEALEMAREFAGLCGGRLTVAPQTAETGSFSAVLALPVTQQIEVLVVDDNLDTLRLMQRYLEGTRYRFLGAHDPEGALALAEAQPPRIIVLDVMMPGIDDWELLGRFRAPRNLRRAHHHHHDLAAGTTGAGTRRSRVHPQAGQPADAAGGVGSPA